MSEINSIAQGTYTLGQTSATTYQAGPGISITQPSEGTVRIANDEAVLFESNAGAKEATLSEGMSHFERLKIKLGNVNATDGSQYFELPAIPSQIKNLCYCAGGGTNFYQVCLYCSATDTSISITKQASIVKPFESKAVNGQDTNTAYIAALHEVIGINRISGGNA